MEKRSPPKFDKAEHDQHRPNHRNVCGHYCVEWDWMWICGDCSEFDCCYCEFPLDDDEIED